MAAKRDSSENDVHCYGKAYPLFLSALVTPRSGQSKKAEAMKAQGHPDYHFITVVMTDGTEFRTRSTMGQAGARLSLDIDPKTHPAWTGGEAKVAERGRVSKFNQKFKGFLG